MSDKVIVITGASSGIGAALARRLAHHQHRLVLAARNSERLAATAAACGGRAICVQADVTQRDDIERLRDTALASCRRVDVWVNNAGRGITREVLDLTDGDVDEMFLVNTKSALYGMQAIVPHFKARGDGHIINISSLLSRVPAASFRSAYSAAKAALNILTANLRMNLQATYPLIHVSLVLPGAVSTGFAENALGGIRPPTGVAPPQTPEEVARVIADVIDHPVPEAYTSAKLPEIVRRYLEDVADFERRIATSSPTP
jgi:short-subunit dehydrogenase